MKMLLKRMIGRAAYKTRFWMLHHALSVLRPQGSAAEGEDVSEELLWALENTDGAAAVSILRGMGATVGDHVRVYRGLVVYNAMSDFRNLGIGSNVHIGRQAFLDVSECISIGNRVTIAMRGMILTHSDSGDCKLYGQRVQFKSKAPVIIEDDVYVGAGATILPGVTVARGSVVAAGAVVAKDVPRNSLVGGIPAKTLRSS
jgi:serine acetyltransferase